MPENSPSAKAATAILNEVPEHMAQELRPTKARRTHPAFLNEVPEHMAQECQAQLPQMLLAIHSSMKFLSTWLRNRVQSARQGRGGGGSSMKFLSTWLRNFRACHQWYAWNRFLNEVPEHMAQEFTRPSRTATTGVHPQ